MKLLGSILIIVSCTLFGFFKAYSLKMRSKSLLEIRNVLKQLKTQICFLKNDLSTALISSSSGLFVSPLFSDFAHNLKSKTIDEAWELSLENNFSKLYLTPSDKEVLKIFSAELGKTDISGQLRHLEFLEELTSEQYRIAEAEYEKKASILKSTGTAVGIFTVLILI